MSDPMGYFSNLLGYASDAFNQKVGVAKPTDYSGVPYVSDLQRIQSITKPTTPSITSSGWKSHYSGPFAMRTAGYGPNAYSNAYKLPSRNGDDSNGDDPKGDDPKGDDPKGDDPKGDGDGAVAQSAPAYVADTWSPIPIPDMNVQLNPEQLAALLGEATQFGNLKYDPLMTEYGNQEIANQKWGTTTIANEKPEWWSSMRNIANQVANALGEYATRTNQLGRFESGQLGSGSSAIQAGGINQIGTLESGLTKRIGDVNNMVKDKAEAISNLKAGVEREKGLTVALQNATLQREAIANEKDTRVRMFDMALASATDARDQQRLTIAKNQFISDLDQRLYERTVTERSLALQQESAALENALTQKQIDGFDATISGYSSGPSSSAKGGFLWTDPNGRQIWIDSASEYNTINNIENPKTEVVKYPLTSEVNAAIAAGMTRNNIYEWLQRDYNMTPSQANSKYFSYLGGNTPVGANTGQY